MKPLKAPKNIENIRKHWKYTGTTHVSIVCTTYNHRLYIKNAIEGFLAQETEYKFEIIIHDDASTDGTTQIITEYQSKYPEIIKAVLQSTNQYQQGKSSMMLAIGIAKSRYIAICEGDDYWIDKHKIQKQAEILENNPSIGLVHSNCFILNQKNAQFKRSPTPSSGLNFKMLLADNRIQTLTVMMRKKIAINFIKEMSSHFSNWKMKDYPLWLYSSYHSDIAMLDDFTSVYRVLEESVSHTKDKKKQYLFERSYCEIKYFYYSYYNQNSPDILQKAYNLWIIAQAIIHKDDEFLSQIPPNTLSKKLSTLVQMNKIIPLRRFLLLARKTKHFIKFIYKKTKRLPSPEKRASL